MAKVPIWKRLAPIGKMPLSRRRRHEASGKEMVQVMLKSKRRPLAPLEPLLRNRSSAAKRVLRHSVLTGLMAHAKSMGLPFEVRDYDLELTALRRHNLERQGVKIIVGARPAPEYIETLTRNLRNQCTYFQRILKREGDTFMLMELPGVGKSLRPPTRVFLRKRNGRVERVIEELLDEPSTPKPDSRYKIRQETIVWFDERGRLQLKETNEDL